MDFSYFQIRFIRIDYSSLQWKYLIIILDCRDYTYDDCAAPGPFETNRDLETEKKCQEYCYDIYDGADENPKCEFYAWDNQKKDCSFYDYPLDDYTNSCDGVAGTPLPGLTDCQASTDECVVSTKNIIL